LRRETTVALTVDQLLDMSQDELDELFRTSPPGAIPDGEGSGTAIVAPGTPLADIASKVVREVAWQGKVFDAAGGVLRNKVGPVGSEEIVARVYPGESWFDQRPCTVLDYSQTSEVAQKIRDEIREVGPGLYLGIVFIGDRKTINFALRFGGPAGKEPFLQQLRRRIAALFGR
jgi:hypothetical protein